MKCFLRVFLMSLMGFVFLIHPISSKGQHAEDSLQISLITGGPGEDLYTAFGHSAIRVKNYTTGDDYVFNYGTFDFSTSHFYWKFATGKLMYFLSVARFQDFYQEYTEEDRELVEQILNLTGTEKQEIFNFLVQNYRPENRAYQYDFLFDNCATRIRDILEDEYPQEWTIEDIVPQKGLTFRQLLNSYMQHTPWTRLGVNILFGMQSDKAMTNEEIMFLPDFLMKGFAYSSLSGKPLVKESLKLYEPAVLHKKKIPFYSQPWFWLSLFGLAVVALSFMKQTPRLDQILSWVDRCLFFITGLLGWFLLFMWFGTDHDVTVWNLNLLWLFPGNLIFSFYFFRNKMWVKKYAIFLLFLNIVLLAGWFLLPQQFPYAALPIIAALSSRAWKIAKRVRRI